MSAIRFETLAPVVESAPNRADIACFVGFVRRRRGRVVPPEVCRWLAEHGWLDGPFARSGRRVATLRDLPVPIESWEVFDHLFEWEARALDGSGASGPTYLGAAVRSFFAQGGRRCYVVRVAAPWHYDTPRERRLPRVARLLPGFPGALDVSPADRRSWRGVGHLLGLPDVSFLSLPDLPDAFRVDPQPPQAIELPPPPEERFVECSDGEGAAEEEHFAERLHAPRCDEDGYGEWAAALRLVLELITREAREVQLVAALPLLPPGMPARRQGLEFLANDELLRFLVGGRWLVGSVGSAGESLASAFLQLVYPWVRTPGSLRLPEGVEPADGALAGLLARNALTRGTFRSAAGLAAGDVVDIFPALGRSQLERAYADPSGRSGPPRTLLDRICLFGPSPGGLRLLSDVTTSAAESYRPAPVNRLVQAMLRAARPLGEEAAFESSSERVWRMLEERISDLMLGLLRAGALHGSTPGEAFEVRCDRTTMNQNDLDNGRILVRILFRPTVPVERLTLVLAVDEGGHLSVVGTAAREAA